MVRFTREEPGGRDEAPAGMEIPDGPPLALTKEFGSDEAKAVQWQAFVRKSNVGQNVPGLPEVLSYLSKFLLPPLNAASGQRWAPQHWDAGGPWRMEAGTGDS